jgi:hypothetical protein
VAVNRETGALSLRRPPDVGRYAAIHERRRAYGR